MKIICAGFQKTGTKSLSRALEMLGYKGERFFENVEYRSNQPRKKFRNWLLQITTVLKPNFEGKLRGYLTPL